eukprot:TRINITY_DN13508_c0_g1_i1.p1 TRINITY_DN13508_c0_g1~~TRINITY_DN13508_c0_g1_i1.p1  ORF type:complete len:140 (+),score=24.06 TRINITY_DN13508_c0_g1_i1:1446-1865(+)
MRTILEAPVPFIIGFNQDIKELPPDVIRVNLDCNRVTINDPLPKLPSDLYRNLFNKLKAVINFPLTNYDPILQNVDQAFTVMLIDPEEQVEFNLLAVRDTILELMVALLKDYQKFVVRLELSLGSAYKQDGDARVECNL